MARLLLLDGHSWIRRAVHTRSTRDRELIFLDLLQRTVGEFRPDYFLAAVDGPRTELVRRQWYPEYKANRSATADDDLRRIKGCEEILAASGVAVVHAPGWEADDVIATAAAICAGPRCEVVIASLDKDLGQCVTAQTTLWNGKALAEVSDIESRWGVAPELVPQVQALAGDSSDNLPGARGIGEKTAIDYIRRFGSLPRLYENLDRLTAAKRKALEEFDWQLGLRMVTLRTDLRLPVVTDDLEWNGFDMRAIGQVLSSLGV